MSKRAIEREQRTIERGKGTSVFGERKKRQNEFNDDRSVNRQPQEILRKIFKQKKRGGRKVMILLALSAKYNTENNKKGDRDDCETRAE